jgi:inositol-pentakisphosphate 2-kinase
MASERYIAIPADAEFQYVAEGAANIVYRILLRPRTPPGSVLDEFGDGTPPPSSIEPDIDLESNEFDSKHLIFFLSSL